MAATASWSTTPATVRHVLMENASAYEKPAPTRRLTRPIIGEGVFLSEGREWRRQRRALSPAFTPQHVERLTPHFAAAARGLVESLVGRDRSQLARALQEAALDAAARSMFSHADRRAGIADRGPGADLCRRGPAGPTSST